MVGLIPQQCMIALILYRHVVSRMLLGHVTIVMLAVLRLLPIATMSSSSHYHSTHSILPGRCLIGGCA